MKAILEFDLDNDDDEYRYTLVTNATELEVTLSEIKNYLRSLNKYDQVKAGRIVAENEFEIVELITEQINGIIMQLPREILESM